MFRVQPRRGSLVVTGCDRSEARSLGEGLLVVSGPVSPILGDLFFYGPGGRRAFTWGV